MSRWAQNNPQLMEEIASLPLREQVPAMRDAMPDPFWKRCHGCGCRYRHVDGESVPVCPLCGERHRLFFREDEQ